MSSSIVAGHNMPVAATFLFFPVREGKGPVALIRNQIRSRSYVRGLSGRRKDLGEPPCVDRVLRHVPVQVRRAVLPPDGTSFPERSLGVVHGAMGKRPLLERKKRLKAILPRHRLIGFSRHRKAKGSTFFAEAERRGLEGIMAKRVDSAYAPEAGLRTGSRSRPRSGRRSSSSGFTAPRRTRPFFGALVLAVREKDAWRYIGHVGTGFSHQMLAELHSKLTRLKAAKSPFPAKVKNEAVTTWVRPSLVAEVKFAEWTTKGELRQPVYLGLRSDKQAKDAVRERERPRT